MTERSKARRAHTKSRNGCQRCKARKVKCDETRPHCRNCVKHAIDCFYSQKRINESSTTATSIPPLADTLSTDGSPSVPTDLTDPKIRIIPRPYTDLEIGMADLELLHHYSTSACYTISRLPVLQAVWRIKVPQFGFSFPFVMRGILAFSALHLAHLRPERRAHYVAQAEFHHTQALQAVSAIIPNMSEENAPAIYLISSITCLISCAKPRLPHELWIIGDRDIEWLSLFRGTAFIISAAEETIKFGVLSPIFKNGNMRSRARNGRSTTKLTYLNELRQFVTDHVLDTGEIHCYLDAIDDMGKSFATVEEEGSQNCQPADVFVWPLQISNEYLNLLRQRKPEALVIFSYFCVITHHLEWAWWMQGLSIHMIRSIYHCLDDQYRCWIQWPMEQLGWAP
ncbi:hypothetical protein N7462_001162 [Penicillium macrosclerotiorum]|uniref:uncharacterized protein n=1 Tax=Penicillium macrosclerotiorum TaxID=303699 RepID=UPI002547C6D0|nr:uncharacterized protein N7462_001162 [Penicillium macrosclerotiorum]KAJ5699157.1 hypothetical protein N7462_001162 [Penicillium macrosclerotiorum]